MKLKIRNGIIFDAEDNDRILAVMSQDATEEDERLIELGSEAVPIIEKFVSDVNSGSFKPRTAVKEFEKILDKYQR
jgi:hypothetical protein